MSSDESGLVSRFWTEMNVPVVGVTLGLLAVFALLRAVVLPQAVAGAVADIKAFLVGPLGWFFMGLLFICALFVLFVTVHPIGSIRLGGPEAEPSYSYPAYFAMFFSAGIAAGVVNSGTTNVLLHYTGSPIAGATENSAGSAAGAIQTAMFNSGLSAWGAYVAVAIPIAYYAYNKGAPLRFSTILFPVVGEDRLDSPLGYVVDILAVFATIGGLATTVGLVGGQFLTGVEYQWGVSTGQVDTVITIGAIAAIFIVSVVTGVNRGIRRIAEVNVAVFLLLLVGALVLGPLAFVLTAGGQALFGYVTDFLVMSFGPLLNGGWQDWYAAWSLFYWVWWLSWAPFAGLFIAAISRGRRLRTIALTTLASVAGTFAWFAIAGGSVLHALINGTVPVDQVTETFGSSVIGFATFAGLPLGLLFVLLFMLSIVTWTVTSADTATLVIAILATDHGVAPSTVSRAFWGVLFGIFTVGVLFVGTGFTTSLQTSAVVTGAPIGLIVLVGLAGLAKELWNADTEGGLVTALQDQLN
jgi:glycine betaine transporter